MITNENILIGKKVEVRLQLFDVFEISYRKVVGLIRLIEASNKIDGVSKFDNSLSFGAKQNAIRKIFYTV